MPKLGYLTASAFNSVMTRGTKTKAVLGEATRIACERLGVDLDQDDFLSRAMEWGIENEPLAVRAYEADTFLTVHSRQEFVSLPGRMVGCHPDGLIGDDGLLEVKCPNSDNHLLNIAYNQQVSDYIHQVQASLWITGRQWCDFVSFDPRFPEPLQLHVVRISRDEEIISAIDERAALIERMAEEMVENVSIRMNERQAA